MLGEPFFHLGVGSVALVLGERLLVEVDQHECWIALHATLLG